MGVILHQGFRILSENTSNTNFNNGSNMTAKFNPSMAIIIIVLISAFLFMGFFSIYVRRCTRGSTSPLTDLQQQYARNAAAARPSQGLDRSVVEALPLVGYNLVKGLKGGKELSECAVCLSDFEDDEDLRLLPKCGHIFHPDCIDMWFHSHSTCPLCRASLLPAEGKEGVEEPELTNAQELQNWVQSRGVGPNGETFTIHDGPPVPPNGSILELLSRDGADRILAESLRRTERLDAGLARREGEDANAERAAGIRALNRTLSRNSTSFRSASRGADASDRINAHDSGSGRFNSSSVSIGIDDSSDFPNTGKDMRKSRSIGASHSFNMALLRSSSVGSSGRYLRQMFGPRDKESGSFKLLGSEHRLPVVNPMMRREQSAQDLSNIEIPVWEDVDLNAEAGAGGNATAPRAAVPGALSYDRWASRGRKFFSGEMPLTAGGKRMEPMGEPSGQPRKEKEFQGEERTKSERWNFGQSFRRTFSLKRTLSTDIESSSQNGNNKPVSTQSEKPGPSAPSKAKKFSPWAGAMKFKRSFSGGDGLPSPHSPSAMAFPQSVPVDSFIQSRSVDSVPESRPVSLEHQQQPQSQHQSTSPAKEDSVHIVTQP